MPSTLAPPRTSTRLKTERPKLHKVILLNDDYTPRVFWAQFGTSLKSVMFAMHQSQTAPVALFDESSRFVGAISVRDVLSAMLRR